MSLRIQKVLENQRIYTLKQRDMSKEEVIQTAKHWWSSGKSDIYGVIHVIKSKNYKIKVISEKHLVSNSINQLKNNVLTIFSHDLNMKGFIQNHINSSEILWYGNIVNGKLILANFINYPTGNMIFNKNLYRLNYFEIEVVN